MPSHSTQWLQESRNTVELNRERLHDVLAHLSTLLNSYFPSPVRLIVHGGACMLLHPGLYSINQSTSPPAGVPSQPTSKRTTTRDVDYINRSFVAEWRGKGIHDATKRLQKCIRKTASHFGLGFDWMNSDADVALPMSTDVQGQTFDPIAQASLTAQNISTQTVYMSPNGFLTLISVSPAWALALKFVRYKKYDPEDIVAIMISAIRFHAYKWTPENLEHVLRQECAPMNFAYYSPEQMYVLRGKIQHAIGLLGATGGSGFIEGAAWPGAPATSPSSPTTSFNSNRFAPRASTWHGESNRYANNDLLRPLSWPETTSRSKSDHSDGISSLFVVDSIPAPSISKKSKKEGKKVKRQKSVASSLSAHSSEPPALVAPVPVFHLSPPQHVPHQARPNTTLPSSMHSQTSLHHHDSDYLSAAQMDEWRATVLARGSSLYSPRIPSAAPQSSSVQRYPPDYRPGSIAPGFMPMSFNASPISPIRSGASWSTLSIPVPA